jgi:hypothetical protein
MAAIGRSRSRPNALRRELTPRPRKNENPPKWPPPSSPSPTRRAASARPRPRSTSRRARPEEDPHAPDRPRPPGERDELARDREAGGPSLYAALRGEGDALPLVTPTAYEHLALIPSEEDLAAAEIELSQMDNYLMKLRGVLQPVVASGGFRAIIIDCPRRWECSR